LVVSYVTKDGVFIGTGAQIASGSISTGPWQRADGSYPSSFVGTWGGATLPNQKAASPADTCSDWTSNSSAATGRFGAGNNQDYFFSFFTNARACSDPNTALFCVEQ